MPMLKTPKKGSHCVAEIHAEVVLMSSPALSEELYLLCHS